MGTRIQPQKCFCYCAGLLGSAEGLAFNGALNYCFPATSHKTLLCAQFSDMSCIALFASLGICNKTLKPMASFCPMELLLLRVSTGLFYN